MRYFIVPLLIEFEIVSTGIEMSFWAATHLSRFKATINGSVVRFETIGKERYINGELVKGFRAYSEGLLHFPKADLAPYPEVCLVGALRFPLEEIGSDLAKRTCRIQRCRSVAVSPQAKP